MRSHHVDLDGGWIDYPRRKTGVQRSFPMWKETREALLEYQKVRPEPKTEADGELVFLSRRGNCLCAKTCIQVTRMFKQLMDSCGGDYPARTGFYSLRHTFITVGRQTGLDAYVQHIAGHKGRSITDNYTQEFSPDVLIDVCTHVRDWLFSTKETTAKQRPSML